MPKWKKYHLKRYARNSEKLKKRSKTFYYQKREQYRERRSTPKAKVKNALSQKTWRAKNKIHHLQYRNRHYQLNKTRLNKARRDLNASLKGDSLRAKGRIYYSKTKARILAQMEGYAPKISVRNKERRKNDRGFRMRESISRRIRSHSVGSFMPTMNIYNVLLQISLLFLRLSLNL